MSESVAQGWSTRLSCKKPSVNPQLQVKGKQRKKNVLSTELTFADDLKP